MGIKQAVMGMAAQFMMERPGKSKSYAQWADELERTGSAVEARVAAAKDPAAASKLRHITGIERWGQSRLRVLLGEPLTRDEYDGYQPTADLPLAEQITAFHAARQETIALARTLEQRNIPDSAKVEHNDFGPMTARGWLSYLSTHASIESKRIN